MWLSRLSSQNIRHSSHELLKQYLQVVRTFGEQERKAFFFDCCFNIGYDQVGTLVVVNESGVDFLVIPSSVFPNAKPEIFSGRFPVKSVMFVVVPIVAAIGIAEFMAASSRAEALNFIQGSSRPIVYVNQQPVSDPERLISALKMVSPKLSHHSHPTKKITVDINSEKGHITLELARDSDYSQEYWIFYPKYRVTSNNEIGRITTSDLTNTDPSLPATVLGREFTNCLNKSARQ